MSPGTARDVPQSSWSCEVDHPKQEIV
jgi:hypothetical protein